MRPIILKPSNLVKYLPDYIGRISVPVRNQLKITSGSLGTVVMIG
jgi:hypothetical protein